MKATYGDHCYLPDIIVDRSSGIVESKIGNTTEFLLEGTGDDSFSDCDTNCTTQHTENV